jgi:protein-disulfide isomerase
LQRAQAAMQGSPEQRWGAFAEIVGYLQFFSARGVSTDQAKTCLADLAKAKQVADFAQKYGSEFNVTGTPTLEINGSRIENNTWKGLEVALQNAGAR